MINSNPIDQNGLQITEGAKVLWNNPQRYQDHGYYIVDEVFADVLNIKNDYRQHVEYASIDEVVVQVR